MDAGRWGHVDEEVCACYLQEWEVRLGVILKDKLHNVQLEQRAPNRVARCYLLE